METRKTWKKRCLCWVLLFSLLFSVIGMQLSNADNSAEQEIVDVTPAPTAVPETPKPKLDPTAVPEMPEPKPDPTAVLETPEPKPDPTAVPEMPEPNPDSTVVPETLEPEPDSTVVPETPEPETKPTAVPEEEPSQPPEKVAYAGYAQLTEKVKVFDKENTKTVAYRLPRGTVVYVDHVVLEDVERVLVSYAIDGKKADGYIEASSLGIMTEQAQDDFKRNAAGASDPVFYDAQQQIPLQSVTPEYPAAAISQAEDPSAKAASRSAEEASKSSVDISASGKATYNCTTVGQMQSPHPYGNSRDDYYVYTKAGAERIAITFSGNTYVETCPYPGYYYDAIFLFGGNSSASDFPRIGVYQGSQLANKTIVANGDTVIVNLDTDGSNTYYGFRATAIDVYKVPSKPTATPQNANGTSIRLTWNAAGPKVSKYEVHRSINGGAFSKLTTVNGTSHNATIQVGQEVRFKIRAVYTINGRQYQSSFSPGTAVVAIGVPNLTLTRGGGNTTAKWNKVANADGYEIYKSANATSGFSLLATLTGAASTQHIDSAVDPGSFYKVRAFKTINGTKYFGSYSVTKAFPKQPEFLNVNILGRSSMKLTWKALPEMTGYQVWRSTSPNGPFTKIAEVTKAMYTDSKCAAGVVNYYRVRAYYGATTATRTYGFYSTVASGYGLAKSASLSLARSGNGVKLTWAKVPYASGYDIYRKTKDGSFVKVHRLPGQPKITWEDTGVTNAEINKGLYYMVRPYKNVNGTFYIGPQSEQKTLPAKVSLAVPTAPANNQIKLTWEAIPGMSGYQIWRSTSRDSGYTKIKEVTQATFIDKNSVAGQVNYYKVRAFIKVGTSRQWGQYSNIVTGFRFSAPTLSMSGSRLTWTKVPYAYGYTIYKKPAGGTYAAVTSVTGQTTTAWTDPAGIQVNEAYMVRAYRTIDGVKRVGPSSNAQEIKSTYRALLIGNTYANYSGASTLSGPPNDTSGMQTMLGKMSKSSYSVTRKSNLNATQILNSITSTFSGATANDVSLFYYSGHGGSGGTLVGNNGSTITPSQLRTKLNSIKGAKVVIIDACHSGGMIGKEATKKETDAFVNSFMSAFTGANRSANNLADGGFYVITAAHSSQTSLEVMMSGSPWHGLFTNSFCSGAGWNYAKSQNTNFPADSNSDSKFTLQELFAYANNEAGRIASQNFGHIQTAQVYPSNSSFVVFGR